MQRRTALILAILLPLQIICLQVLKSFPGFVERYYSLGIYPIISKTSRYLFGWVPFSVGDVFYTLIGIVAIRWLYVNFQRLRFEPIRFFLDIFAAISVVYFMFHALWGFNYYRLPLHQSLEIKSEYSYDELLSTTVRFIEKSNSLHRKLASSDSEIGRASCRERV